MTMSFPPSLKSLLLNETSPQPGLGWICALKVDLFCFKNKILPAQVIGRELLCITLPNQPTPQHSCQQGVSQPALNNASGNLVDFILYIIYIKLYVVLPAQG